MKLNPDKQTAEPTQEQLGVLHQLQQLFHTAGNMLDATGNSALDHLGREIISAGAINEVIDGLNDMFPPEPTYSVVRFYLDDKAADILLTGLTMEEAKYECSKTDLSGDGYINGYLKENQ